MNRKKNTTIEKKPPLPGRTKTREMDVLESGLTHANVELLLRHLPVGIFQCSYYGELIYANSYLVGALKYRNFKELQKNSRLFPEIASAYLQKKNKLNDGNDSRPLVIEKTLKCQDKTFINVEIFLSEFEAQDNTYLVGCFNTRKTPREKRLQIREAVMAAISFAAETFLAGDDWQQVLPEILKKLGRAVRADRAFVFENFRTDDDRIVTCRSAEWCAPGVAAQSNNYLFQNVAYQSIGLERWEEKLKQGEMLKGQSEEFPEKERLVLDSIQVKALLAAPIFLEKEWWGFAGFEACKTGRGWSEIEEQAITTFAALLAAAIISRQTRLALKETTQKYTSTMAALNEGLWEWNVEADEFFLNAKCYEMLGYRDGVLPEAAASWQALIHPDDAPEVVRAMKKHLQGETAFYEKLYRCRAADGNWQWLLDRGAIVERNEHQAPVKMVGTHTDITALRKYMQDL